MKRSEIKKALGKGTMVWVECFRGADEASTVIYRDVIEYSNNCLYPFERFIEKDETDSKIVKFLCEKYSINKVFAYQPCLVGTNGVDPESNTLFGKVRGNDVYDCDCSYLIVIKKEDAEQLSIDGEEFLIRNM